MNEHTSKKFDLELESLRTHVLQMGGLAEQQVRKAIERIGDHATNIAEHVVYMVEGLNVRHSTASEVEAQIRGA